MKSCARAPVRVDPAGAGTDAPPYCLDHGGAVVNIGVEHHVFASAQKLPAGSGVIVYSLDMTAGAVAKRVSDFAGEKEMEFLKAFVLRMVPEGDSVLLVTESDVPPGSGLGGSGALGVAITAAISRLYEQDLSQTEIAALANSIERKDLGYPGGDQDSLGAALGGVNFLEYHQGGGVTPHKVQLDETTCRALEYHSLLIYTGASHVSGSIHADIKRSYGEENSPTLRAMQGLEEQAKVMARALEAGSLAGYAAALNESCAQLYNLHDSCRSEEHQRFFTSLDDLILGGKTCGAGGGGFILVLAKPGRRRECLRLAEEMGGTVWPLTIDDRGVTTWLEPALSPEEIERLRTLAGETE